jgi:hypothetical protein
MFTLRFVSIRILLTRLRLAGIRPNDGAYLPIANRVVLRCVCIPIRHGAEELTWDPTLLQVAN